MGGLSHLSNKINRLTAVTDPSNLEPYMPFAVFSPDPACLISADPIPVLNPPLAYLFSWFLISVYFISNIRRIKINKIIKNKNK
jgi:hypothetical protein